MSESTGEKVLRTTKRIINSAGSAMLPDEKPPVPLEDINTKTVAERIFDGLRTPIQHTFQGVRHANQFSMADILPAMGYQSILLSTDYIKKFPKEYRATLRVLKELVHRKIIGSVELDDYDLNNEKFHYRVQDEDGLASLAGKTLK